MITNMTIEDMVEFLRLLHLYEQECIADDKMNRKIAENPDNYNSWDGISGVKAQFNHARCIEKRVALEVENAIKTI